MAQVTLPYTLTAGTPENVNNLMSNLTALRDGVNTIDTAQLAASSVTAAKLATDAVETAKIKDANVTAAKLASDAKGALTLVSTTTMSSAASINVDSVFTSTYNNYRVVLDSFSSSNAGYVSIELRSGGSNGTGTCYYVWRWYALSGTGADSGSGYSFGGAGGAKGVNVGHIDSSGNGLTHWFDVSLPQASAYTRMFIPNFMRWSDYVFSTHGPTWNNTTAYDGFQVNTPASTSGTIRVYGYAK